MASPVVEQAIESAVQTTAVTAHTVNLPTATAGQLLLIIADKGSTSATITVTAGATLTELLDEASANGLYIAYRWMDGTEGTTLTLTTSAATRLVEIAYRISGAMNPATNPPQIGSTGTGTSATPDPPASAAPPVSKDYLFIAFFGQAGEEADDDTWVNTPPTNYTPSPPRQKTCGTAGSNLGGKIGAAERALTTGVAENPGTFAVDVSAAWRSQTITIHPGATVVTRQVAVDATAGIASAPQRVHLRSAALSASADIAAAGKNLVSSRSAALGAIAAISAGRFTIMLRQAALAATSGIATGSLRIAVASASLAATADIASASRRDHLRAGALGATADIAVSGESFTPTGELERQVALAATAAISAGRFAILLRQAAIGGTAQIAAAGLHIVERAAALSASADIATAPRKFALRQAALSASAGIVAAGEISGALVRSVALSATADITAGRQLVVLRSAGFAANAAVQVAGVRVRSRAAALQAQAVLQGAGLVERSAQVRLEVTATWQAAGQRDLLRSIDLDAVADIAVAGEVEGEVIGRAELIATADIAVNGTSYNPTEDWDLPPPGEEWPVAVGAEWLAGVGAEWPMPKTGG